MKKQQVSEKLLNDTLAKELIRTSSDVGCDYLEVPIDLLLDDNLFKDIPIVKTVYSICKTGMSVRDMLFTKKLYVFISSFKSGVYDKDNLESFRMKLCSNEKYKYKVTSHIIEMVDRLQSEEKSKLLSKLFLAYIDGEYEWDIFVDLSSAIESLLILDCKVLEFLYKNPYEINISEIELGNIDKYLIFASIQRLESFAFVYEKGISIGSFQDSLTKIISITDFGKKFYKLILES